MLDFRKIELSDRGRICAALRESDFMGCEYSFANNFAWCRLAESEICFYKNFYIICAFATDDNIPTVTFPSGSGDIVELFGELRKFAENGGFPLRVGGVTEKTLNLLTELFPDSFTVMYDRDGSDYIYSREKLAALGGRKYHGKRNHLAKFGRYDSEFSLISENDFDECICFLTQDYNAKTDSGRSAIAEQYAINAYFSHFHELGLVGGLIRTGGKVAAVTIGERLNGRTFCVHIEKADRNFEGIYAAINNFFVRSCMGGYDFVNREEDLGIEGLRRSKLSYHPEFLLDKYILTFK